MYPLLVAGILLLVLLGQREHLTFTATIKDVRTTVSPADQDRIFAMAPTSLQRRAQTADPSGPKLLVAQIVRDFQREVYVPATAPITDTVVDSFIGGKRTFYRASPTAAQAAFFLEAYSSGDAKRLLLSYFNVRAPTTVPPLSSAPSPSAGGSVPRVLDQMRDSLLEYKMTGDSRYKTVYDGLKSWMDRYVATLTAQLTRDATAITTEVNTYRTANTDLTRAQSEFRKVQRDGPAAETAYLTLKKQMDQVPEPDQTSFYVKVGIAVGLVLGAIVLSLV